MTSAGKTWLIAILILIVLTGIFIGGFYTYPRIYPPPVFTNSHTVVYDTAKKHIYSIWPWYIIEQKDSIIINEIPADVDTAAILTAFYSTYQYTRTFEDSLLKAVLEDGVTQNKPAVISFDYTIKRPQQIVQNIDKSVYYNKYLLFGLNVPFKDMKYGTAELTFVAPKWYVGAGYMPKMQSLTVKAGITLFKFK